MRNQKITIKVDEKNPQPVEIIAKSIIDIAKAFKQLKTSSLNERAIILLLNDMTGVSKTDIRTILIAAPKLAEYYLK